MGGLRQSCTLLCVPAWLSCCSSALARRAHLFAMPRRGAHGTGTGSEPPMIGVHSGCCGCAEGRGHHGEEEEMQTAGHHGTWLVSWRNDFSLGFSNCVILHLSKISVSVQFQFAQGREGKCCQFSKLKEILRTLL